MEKAIKVLMISSDRNVLSAGSAVSERMKEYAALVGELYIVLLSDSAHGLKEAQLAPNLWVYPTNSALSILRPLGAASLGKKIVYERKFVRGASLITADSIECGWAGLQVKKRWRLPLEVQVHTDPFSPYFSGFQNSVRKFFARKVFAAADAVRVVSKAVGEKVAAFTKAPVFILPIYVDRDRIENAPVSFDVHARYGWHFILLAASRLTPEKDLGTALRAVALARQASPNIGLLIAGSGTEEGRLKTLAKSLGIGGAVEFVGWQNDLASFYKTSNAFLQTSLFEGYGLALVEAGLSNLPVITTPVGIASELSPENDVVVVSPQRPDLFAQAILDLMNHNAKRETLRQNLKRTLETKLLIKEKYLQEIGSQWGRVATFAS